MAFFYRDHQLKVGAPGKHPETYLDVAELARQSDRPTYIYDLDSIDQRYRQLEKAFSKSRNTIHYAMKANSHPAILQRLRDLGSGVDTVSGGEIRLALQAGFKPESIIFSGVGKTVSEIELAIQTGIKQINVESPQELKRISEIAQRLGKLAPVAFRLNPDVNPQTHPYITTGFRENKFGMDESFIPELLEILSRSKDSLQLRGLTMHIGSQLFDLDCLADAIRKTVDVHQSLSEKGFRLDRIDIGGGLGVHYDTDDETEELAMIQKYGEMAQATLAGLDVEVLTEPGRTLVARAGTLVGEVQYVKKAPAKTFVILNTGMHHLLRPALYGARHRVLPVLERQSKKQNYDIVGPICESSDFLAKDIELPEVQPGDLIALADSGAYGFAMASHYNAHDLPREIAVSQGKTI